MRAKRANSLVWAGVVAILIFPALGLGNISTQSWYMDQSNTFADGVNYGQVTITADSTAGTVKFTVDAFDIQPLYGDLDNFGMDKFGFSYKNVTSSPSSWGLSLPASWQQKTGETIDGFGNFLAMEKGTGSSREDPLVFTLTLPTASEAVAENFGMLSTGTASEGHVYFAAHVAGFDAAGKIGSHFIGGSTVVPEPTTMIFCLIGFGLTGRTKWRFV